MLDEDEELTASVLQTNHRRGGYAFNYGCRGCPEDFRYSTDMNFQQVSAGVGVMRELRVRNLGERPLEILEVRSSGSPDFRPLIEVNDSLVDPSEVEGIIEF